MPRAATSASRCRDCAPCSAPATHRDATLPGIAHRHDTVALARRTSRSIWWQFADGRGRAPTRPSGRATRRRRSPLSNGLSALARRAVRRLDPDAELTGAVEEARQTLVDAALRLGEHLLVAGRFDEAAAWAERVVARVAVRRTRPPAGDRRAAATARPPRRRPRRGGDAVDARRARRRPGTADGDAAAPGDRPPRRPRRRRPPSRRPRPDPSNLALVDPVSAPGFEERQSVRSPSVSRRCPSRRDGVRSSRNLTLDEMPSRGRRAGCCRGRCASAGSDRRSGGTTECGSA